MNEKVKDALKDIEIFFKQCEIEKKYDKQLTNHFLNCKSIIETALNQGEENEKELNELREFAKLFIAEMVDVDCAKECNTYEEYVSCYGRELKEGQFNLVKKVVSRYES